MPPKRPLTKELQEAKKKRTEEGIQKYETDEQKAKEIFIRIEYNLQLFNDQMTALKPITEAQIKRKEGLEQAVVDLICS